MPRETAEHAYTAAHAEAMVLLDTIRQQLQDLPAPDTTTINWGHVGNVSGRFEVELAASVEKYLASSAKAETERVKRARKLELGATKDEVLDAVFKALVGNRRSGLLSGMNQNQLRTAYNIAERYAEIDGSPRTVWGYVNGLTRLSQETPYMNERMFLDRAGSMILAVAV
jgi:hypothetical protein